MDARIALVVARMEQALDQAPRLPELAAAVNLSVSRLSHLFREEVGVAPGRYLHTIRMQRARILLERSFLNVKEVMARVGVADPSHFARDFRKYHGIAPSQVRRAAGQTGEPVTRADTSIADAGAVDGTARHPRKREMVGAHHHSAHDGGRPERDPDEG